jgi:D-alanyl-D-alanine carboxypeptidase/D-alanyl-D-alanine-endopeptidase (penicillin-binding protein 4)
MTSQVEVVVAPGAAVGAAAAVTVPADPGSACFGVAIAATTTASAATVSSPPPPPPPPAAFSSSTAALSLSVDVVRGAVVVAVSGSISVGAPPQSFAVACRDPLRRAADVLAQALRGAGAVGAVSAADAYSVVTDAPECDDTATAATVPMFSAPLAQLLNHTLLESDNTYAEAVLRRLGADGSVAQGLAAVRTVLSNGGGGSASTPGLPVALNLNELSAADGSGLSRHGLVTPRFLAALVAGADPAFISLLPLAGVSGTLANRFVGTVAEGKLRAKTGSMSNVNALTGVVGDVAFAILSDACPQPSSNVRDGIDAIAVLFAEQSPA